MYFTAKFASLLLAVAASMASTQAAVVARDELAKLSVVLYDDVNLSGASYSPEDLDQHECFTLPPHWEDRAESLTISSGYACRFFDHEKCQPGAGVPLSGTVNQLSPDLYDNIESFNCYKV